MFKNVIEFFKKTQEIRDQRFADFDKFHSECVRDFPMKMREALKKENLHPALKESEVETEKYENWVMAFDAKDVLWWREAYKSHNFMCKPIEDIKKATLAAAIGIIDKMPLSELDPATKKLYDSILLQEVIDEKK